MLASLEGPRAEVARAGPLRRARFEELARFYGVPLRELFQRAAHPRGPLDEPLARLVAEREAAWWLRHAEAPLGFLIENARPRARTPAPAPAPVPPEPQAAPPHGSIAICLLSKEETPEVVLAEQALVEVVPTGLRVFRATERSLSAAASAQAYVVLGDVPRLTDGFRGKHFHFWRVTGDASTEEGRRRVQAELREQAACLAQFYAGKRHR